MNRASSRVPGRLQQRPLTFQRPASRFRTSHPQATSKLTMTANLQRHASTSSYMPPAAKNLSHRYRSSTTKFTDMLHRSVILLRQPIHLRNPILLIHAYATHGTYNACAQSRTVGDRTLAILLAVCVRMDQLIGKGIRDTQYKRLITALSGLNKLRRIADLGGREDIAKSIADVIAPFERPNKDVLKARESGRKKPVPDEHGRVYALGRRKTASARVWMIPIQASQHLQSQDMDSVKVSEMLINGLPVSKYSTHTMDRERAFRPLKLTGTLMGYNAFALVRGGGTMAQAEAIALGVSKALQVLEPGVEGILKQGKMLRRDPRMVERKKTNLAKTRKAYTWVKR